jgi:hypothetical protein
VIAAAPRHASLRKSRRLEPVRRISKSSVMGESPCWFGFVHLRNRDARRRHANRQRLRPMVFSPRRGVNRAYPGRIRPGEAGIQWRILPVLVRVAAASAVFGACRWPIAAATRSRTKTVLPACHSAVCVRSALAATMFAAHRLTPFSTAVSCRGRSRNNRCLAAVYAVGYL